MINSEIHNIIFSDHAPLSVIFSLCFNIQKTKYWKFNNMLLRDKTFVALINERISEFFDFEFSYVVIDGLGGF